MLTRRDGCLVALGSVVGEDGNAGQVAYAAAKGALVSGWKALAKELGPRNVRCNVVSPGLVESSMSAALTEEQRAKWAATSSLGRLVRADDVAEAVIGCCECRAMTGQVVRVCCGS